jgi:hypothetical protein
MRAPREIAGFVRYAIGFARRRWQRDPPMGSDQEDRHPDQDQHDHQQRDFDEPGKPDPAAAMSFEFRIDYRHVRLAFFETAPRSTA